MGKKQRNFTTMLYQIIMSADEPSPVARTRVEPQEFTVLDHLILSLQIDNFAQELIGGGDGLCVCLETALVLDQVHEFQC